MVVLENEHLKVTINSKGAELSSLIDKNNNTEYIWQGDENIWNYHAPNLFPIVGNLKNNTLNVDGNSFTMNRHGFARTSTFRRLESAPDHAKFSLDYNEETLKLYPYKFEFQVVYHLSERSLKVAYKVINKDDKDIYFSVGSHPAFNVPAENFEDCYFQFELDENLDTHLLTASGLFSGETENAVIGGKLPLKRNLFDKDALVFKDIQSKSIILRNNKGPEFVKIDFSQFKHLGLWSKPNSSFVCIEPWLGYADSEGPDKDISEKEAIEVVEHGHVFEADFTISI